MREYYIHSSSAKYYQNVSSTDQNHFEAFFLFTGSSQVIHS